MFGRAIHLFGRAVRETGQAIDRLGLRIDGTELFNHSFSRHRPILNVLQKQPKLGNNVFVAPNATIIGQVSISDKASVWYGVVIRGDRGSISIGQGTNVQDRAVINSSAAVTGILLAAEEQGAAVGRVNIGSQVTIGHGALLTGCTVGDQVLIGQGSIIQAGASVGSQSIIAAGAVILPNTVVPEGVLWAGNPAKFVRNISAQEREYLSKSSESYIGRSAEHGDAFTEHSAGYLQAAGSLHH